jgi:hypothetical protein
MIKETIIDAFGTGEVISETVHTGDDLLLFRLVVEGWQNILPCNGWGVYIYLDDDHHLYLE